MITVFAENFVATGLHACGRPFQTDRHRGLSLLVFLLALCSLLPAPISAAAAAAALTPTDLGNGLAYLRVESLTQPLPAVATALVLDLRYVTADEQSPAALKALLATRPASASLFILVSPATPAALTPIITASPALTLGAPHSVPTPKVIVHTDAATDRRAYDALTTGTPLTQLLSGKIEKERYDEATLVKDFKAGIPEPLPGGLSRDAGRATDPGAAPAGNRVPGQTPAEQQPGTVQPPVVDPTAPKPPATSPAEVPVRLHDRVLQRAVHLHAAMRALKPRS